ncbi:unnamed protein product [Boreogadus saida]
MTLLMPLSSNALTLSKVQSLRGWTISGCCLLRHLHLEVWEPFPVGSDAAIDEKRGQVSPLLVPAAPPPDTDHNNLAGFSTQKTSPTGAPPVGERPKRPSSLHKMLSSVAKAIGLFNPKPGLLIRWWVWKISTETAPGTPSCEYLDEASQHDPAGGCCPALGPTVTGCQRRVARRRKLKGTLLRHKPRSLASAPAASMKLWKGKRSSRVSPLLVPAVPAPDTDHNNVAGSSSQKTGQAGAAPEVLCESLRKMLSCKGRCLLLVVSEALPGEGNEKAEAKIRQSLASACYLGLLPPEASLLRSLARLEPFPLGNDTSAPVASSRWKSSVAKANAKPFTTCAPAPTL